MKSTFMKHLNSFLLAAGAALLLAGCASAPSKFYTLDATAKSDGSPAVPVSVVVGPVTVPAVVDRPQFVLTTAPNRVELDEFNRWAAPLNESIARIVSLDLGTLLGGAQTTAGTVAAGSVYRVTIHVERFESVRGGKGGAGGALLEADWSVRTPSGKGLYSGHTVAREPVQSDDLAALAAAHSRALGQLSTDIAAGIRVAETGNH